MLTLYGAPGSGAAAVECALRHLGLPFRTVRAATWEPGPSLDELRRINPMGQVPTLVLEDGTVLTESAAILIHLGLAHASSGLLPMAPSARAKALQGLVFIAANCYPCISLIDYPERFTTATGKASLEKVRQGARSRLHQHWEAFADMFPPQPTLSGAAPGALDYLAVVVSRWSGARAHLAAQRPALAAHLEQVQALPHVAAALAGSAYAAEGG